MLLAIKNEPTPLWSHLFAALDSSSPFHTTSTDTILVFNTTVPLIEALLLLYKPLAILSITPYELQYAYNYRVMTQISYQDYKQHTNKHHFYSYGVYISSSTIDTDRRYEDREELSLLGCRLLKAESIVLIIQRWRSDVRCYHGQVLLPKGWTHIDSYGWDGVTKDTPVLGGQAPRTAYSLTTIFVVRTGAEVSYDDSAACPQEDGRTSLSAAPLSNWSRALKAQQSSGPITWIPYRILDRL